MYRVTTPTHTYTLPMETSTLSVIQVTYKQGKNKIIWHYKGGTAPPGMELDGSDVIIHLTQLETKALSAPMPCKSQVRVLTTGGKAYASQTFTVSVCEVLDEEVLGDA